MKMQVGRPVSVARCWAKNDLREYLITSAFGIF